MSADHSRAGRDTSAGGGSGRVLAKALAVAAAVLVFAVATAVGVRGRDPAAGRQDDRAAIGSGGVARLAPEIPVQRQASEPVGGSFSTPRLLISFAILALGAAVAFGLRRPGGARSSGVMRNLRLPWGTRTERDASLVVVDSARLTGRASLHVVQWRGGEWLIACADGSVTLLGRVGHEGASDALAEPDDSGRGAPQDARRP